MELGTITIALIVLFVLYSTGLIKTMKSLLGVADSSIDKATKVADRRLTNWDSEDEEASTRKLGKLLAKINDSSIDRASAKMVKQAFKDLDAKVVPTATATATP